MELIIANQQFNDAAEGVVQRVMNWNAAKKHEGNNLSATEWNSLAKGLRAALEDAHPDMTIDGEIFGVFDLLVGKTRNLNTVYLRSREIVQAHMDANRTGSRAPLEKLLAQLERQYDFMERNFADVAVTPGSTIAVVARMLEQADMGTLNRVAAVAEKRKPSSHAPLQRPA